MVVPERPQITIWRRVVYWVIQATRAYVHTRPRARASTPVLTHELALIHTYTYTHAEMCNTVRPSTATIVLRTRFSVTVNVHCLSC
jgi:hypothetical protein